MRDNKTDGLTNDPYILEFPGLSENSAGKESRRIFASRYKLVLPTEEELAAELERNARYLRGVGDDE